MRPNPILRPVATIAPAGGAARCSLRPSDGPDHLHPKGGRSRAVLYYTVRCRTPGPLGPMQRGRLPMGGNSFEPGGPRSRRPVAMVTNPVPLRRVLPAPRRTLHDAHGLHRRSIVVAPLAAAAASSIRQASVLRHRFRQLGRPSGRRRRGRQVLGHVTMGLARQSPWYTVLAALHACALEGASILTSSC
jgi:hypothetical protein